MKPLYIRGADTRVELDAPALKIRIPEQADAWLPLRRISRVISATRVGWTSEALLACAAEGISVSFLADDGQVVARLTGAPGERDELRQRLADLLIRPGWRDDYDLWLAGMEQMAARSLARRAGLPAAELPLPRELRRALREQAADQGLLPEYDAVGRRVHGLLLAWVTQQLSEAGIGPEWAGWTELDLSGDFTRVLFWDYRLPRLAWLAARRWQGQLGQPGDAEVTAFFEQRAARTDKLCQGLVNRLHHWLIGQYRWR